LGLSDANVRKKLSRVRELLKEQLLNRYGNLLLSTAPGIGFSAMLASLLVTASPPAAAAGAALAVSGSSSANVGFFGKLGLLLSGAMIGALAGIAGVYFGMQAVLKNAKDEPERVALRRIRNQTMGWVVFCGVLLTLGYEMTSSAWGPLGAFAIFLIGMLIFNLRMAKLIGPRLAEEARQDPAAAQRQRKSKIGGFIGTTIGFTAGAAGLIYNMFEIGRF
jgi:hypothetical protein